jgi:predicted deacetylase
MAKVTIVDVFAEVRLVRQAQESAAALQKELKEALESHTHQDQVRFDQLQAAQVKTETALALLQQSGGRMNNFFSNAWKIATGVLIAWLSSRFGISLKLG